MPSIRCDFEQGRGKRNRAGDRRQGWELSRGSAGRAIMSWMPKVAHPDMCARPPERFSVVSKPDSPRDFELDTASAEGASHALRTTNCAEALYDAKLLLNSRHSQSVVGKQVLTPYCWAICSLVLPVCRHCIRRLAVAKCVP